MTVRHDDLKQQNWCTHGLMTWRRNNLDGMVMTYNTVCKFMVNNPCDMSFLAVGSKDYTSQEAHTLCKLVGYHFEQNMDAGEKARLWLDFVRTSDDAFHTWKAQR